MKELDEETALSVLFSNTKRKKRSTDLLTIAKSCQFLVKLYGSQQAVADRVGISAEMIREFLTTLKLPLEVQKLVSERKIDRVDVVREISTLKDTAKQIAAAEALIHTASKEIRDVKRLVKEAGVSVQDAKRVISEAKPQGLHIFVVDFTDETYREIAVQAKGLKTTPAELIREIVTDWLRQKTKKEEA